ncbi:dynamin family protein [Truepera radiovictrix]|nr:dynamin family protein [Truepera radiovictrix]WMT58587.1 dynamin family protein [Truepera radiovictrix]
MSEAARDFLHRERLVIADLIALLGRLDAHKEDLQELRTALEDLEGLFMLVVCGEYNAGKSTFLNALLGHKVMLEGVTPTTDRITIVTYGDRARDTEEGDFILRREFPAPILQELALVDTPGTNAVIQKHQELTERFVPRADLVLFVTSADRPFTESERRFLELIRSWGKKVVVVVNKFDILEPDEREKVLEFVRDHAREALHESIEVAPQVFGVAAKSAFRARQAGDEAALAASGLPALEDFIERTLSAGARVQLKLASPLGVAHRIAARYARTTQERLALLADDRRTLQEVDRQLEQFKRDMYRGFESYLTQVKTVLIEVERRGDVFFDDTVRLRRILQLMDNERIREAFEARVIRGADKEIDGVVAEMVDWFISSNLQVWEDMMNFVTTRRQAGEERLIGEVGGRFQYDRDALIRGLSASAEEVLSSYNQDLEARRLANALQASAVQTGLIQVGGIGLGAAAVAFLSGAALDATGIVAGITMAGLGFLVLPNRRRVAKRNLHEQMQRLRDGLAESLTAQFEAELRRATDKLSAAISPYTRFVRSESDRLEELQGDLERAERELKALRREVETLDLSAPSTRGKRPPRAQETPALETPSTSGAQPSERERARKRNA